MVTNTLDMTVQLIECYQKELPEIYQEHVLVLEDLIFHINQVSHSLIATEKQRTLN